MGSVICIRRLGLFLGFFISEPAAVDGAVSIFGSVAESSDGVVVKAGWAIEGIWKTAIRIQASFISYLYSQLIPRRHFLKLVQLSPGSVWARGPSGLLHRPSGVPGRPISTGCHWWRTWAVAAASNARRTKSLNIFTDQNWLWRGLPERRSFCTQAPLYRLFPISVGRSQSSINVKIRTTLLFDIENKR